MFESDLARNILEKKKKKNPETMLSDFGTNFSFLCYGPGLTPLPGASREIL